MAEEEKAGGKSENPKEDKKDDSIREFKDTQQEVMWELQMKTNEVLKKFKELQRKNKVKFGRM